jgi:hypothetical protein
MVLIAHILSDFDLNRHFVIAFVTWMAPPCASNKSQARGVVGLPYVGMKFLSCRNPWLRAVVPHMSFM